MENRINSVIEIEDGKKFFVVKQAIYMNENYFIVSAVDNATNDVTDKFYVLHETKENGESFVEVEKDPKILEIILKHLDIKED
ncbi:MAG TPA: hypothetical protein PLV83_05890 [Bacilli bacterium]|mgnify:CR=1 FL=1|nr:hypothetical protein [Bacilli bacterium]